MRGWSEARRAAGRAARSDGWTAEWSSGRRAGRAAALGAAVVLGMLAAGCGGDKGAEAPAVAARPSAAPPTVGAAAADAPDGAPVVLIAGTSLTAGLGIPTDSAYPAELQRIADSAGVPVRVVNAGLSGETTAGLVRRIDWLLRQPADVVVIESGANDGLRGFDVDSTAANLRRIVAAVRAAKPAARVVLVQMEAPPNLGVDYTTRFRAMFPAVAEATGATLAPFLLEGVAGVRRLNQPDGIHPTPEGAAIAARNVWPTVAAVAREAGGDSVDRVPGDG